MSYMHSCPQVVAKAGSADLQDNFKQTHSGSVFSANGLTVTMRIFATAHECCAELIDAGWTICIASSETSHAGSALLSNKVAIVAAEPVPSTAFLQAAAHEAPGKLVYVRQHFPSHNHAPQGKICLHITSGIVSASSAPHDAHMPKHISWGALKAD